MAAGRKRKETTGGAAIALDLEHLRRELDAAGAEQDAAGRERDALEARRDDVLTSEDVAELEAHEVAVAAVERRLAVAQTRHARLAGEVEAAEVEAEQDRRRALYAQAHKALAEARQIIATEYEPAARALAEILTRAARLQSVGRDANAALPEGADPLDLILEPDGFNGQHFRGARGLTETVVRYVNCKTGLPAGPYDAPEMHANAGRWRRVEEQVSRDAPALPHAPHRSIADFVNLPGIGGPETYIHPAPCWGHPRSNS